MNFIVNISKKNIKQNVKLFQILCQLVFSEFYVFYDYIVFRIFL